MPNHASLLLTVMTAVLCVVVLRARGDLTTAVAGPRGWSLLTGPTAPERRLCDRRPRIRPRGQQKCHEPHDPSGADYPTKVYENEDAVVYRLNGVES